MAKGKRKLPNKGTYFITSSGNLMLRSARGVTDWVGLTPKECKKPKKGESKKACSKRVYARLGIDFGSFSAGKHPAKKSGKKSGKLTYAARKKMASGKFVFPHGTKAHPGEKKFPIHDVKHARQALSRAGQPRTKLTHAERCRVKATVCRKYPKVGMCATLGRRKQSKLLKSC